MRAEDGENYGGKVPGESAEKPIEAYKDKPYADKQARWARQALKKSRRGEFRSLVDILPEVGRQMNLDRKVQEWSVLSLWVEIVDERFKAVTRAVRIRKVSGRNRLFVHAKSPAVASELTFLVEQYQNKLNSFSPQTGLSIDGITVRVGS